MLYRKVGSRYREATEGQIISEATEVLRRLGHDKLASKLVEQLVDRIGYEIPTEPYVKQELPPT